MGGVALTEIVGRRNLLCVDMGGTSFDVSLVVDGQPDVKQETALEGLPLLMPIINIHTIGAGGGSIGYLEAGGLRVGPESAGADPGPACYGRGGTQPTVTDANLVLGRIDPETFLGGRMQLDVEAASEAIETLARSLDLEPLQLAEGMLDIVNAKMAQAIRTITVEQGIEPRDFAIVAFGGAGPMHAAFLAQELEIRDVLVPLTPGAFSAWGMLQTKLRHDFSRAYYNPLDEVDLDELAAVVRELGDEGTKALVAEGVAPGAVTLAYVAEMRYVGQEYTVNVELDAGEIPTEGFRGAVADRFDDAHELRYGHANRGAPCELVVVRLTALGDLGRAKPAELPDATNGANAYRSLPVTFARRTYDTPFHRREDLGAGAVVAGPAVIEEHTATTVVPPGAIASVDRFGSIAITLGGD
jgi:N-methylhydantoinase A